MLGNVNETEASGAEPMVSPDNEQEQTPIAVHLEEEGAELPTEQHTEQSADTDNEPEQEAKDGEQSLEPIEAEKEEIGNRNDQQSLEPSKLETEETSKPPEEHEPASRSSSKTRSRSITNKPNYKLDTEGLAIDDDDINDPDAREEDYNEDEDDELEVSSRVTRKRKLESDEDDEDEEEEEEEEDNAEDDNDEEKHERSNSITAIKSDKNLKKSVSSIPVDDEGNPLPVINEEYALPDDPEGEAKITRNGDLLGGRQFLIRTFTLTSRGERKFMLATECARSVGFRDSYLFFQYNKSIYKFVLLQSDKNDLIDRGLIPYSYRNRQIALVSARGVFKVFGAKIIRNGRNITDDYYSTKLRQEGSVVEGTLAREPKVPKKVTARGREGIELIDDTAAKNPAKNAVEFFQRRAQAHMTGTNVVATAGDQLNATNWLYQHAAACSRFNSDMYYDRVRLLLMERQGLRDPYTNVLHIPESTQSSKVIGFYKKIDGNDNASSSIVYETRIEDPDLTRQRSGLLDVSPAIYEGVVSDDIKEAILKQQEFERNL
ncbi:Npl6p NDAI_0H02260 [Naumovozyma dairenensis CBS 421]|uniref:Chromatin structure-remodeling complex protein RSC7 n=1 Tax=Naumovozyma dairenensis (strain ATCC 10597 / BCRC 20456 / CBS 421 / NBRC 0211 / NRRL Y-12639) TaxID=1071378 RepID=G0WF39_NAUDC|nr:hypothetical protein NDAI_0H02260 [Naumovozyma dairenensis CBS 421]CCD26400.1 hypothetical protein NDAI_0H02260 [Naumovozyma dairenensis CBS 421]